MSEPTQAERLAALQAKRAPTTSAERDTNPSTQRVVAAGVSVVSFAAITLAMGPLTAPSETVDAGAGADNAVSSDDGFADQTTALVPDSMSDVVVEVIPHYVPVTEDGTPLPADMLQDDGTLVDASSVAPASTVTPATAAPTPTPTTVAPTTPTPTTVAVPATTAAPPPPPRSEASG